MVDLSDVDASDAGEMMSFEVMEPHRARMYIEEADKKPTKSGDGSYLGLKIKIEGGVHAGRTLYVNLNLWNKNETAVTIAKSEWKAIQLATVGHANVKNSEEIRFKPFEGEIDVRKNKKSEKMENYIKKYEAIGAQPTAVKSAVKSAPVAAATKPPAPWEKK